MANLSKEQRNQLSKVVLQARSDAEAAATKALRSLGVDEADAPSHLSTENRTLRRALRAQARQLGDKESPAKKGSYDLHHLTEKIAYDQWHRTLFARFLAENDLLIAPQHGVPVSLQECRGLAPELGLRDEWDVAVRFAAEILPQIFRPDDPAGKIQLAPEDRTALQSIVLILPRDVFIADDSLGWLYQFWQAKQKDEVNKSENKIGADEIASVTQLFTEHYMVLFLLHNTLGAWWAAKRKAEGKNASLNGIELTYLRLKEDGTPAAGSFPGWPRQAKDVRVLDPCMGSGHFLVTELPILAAMRMEEEGLNKGEACDAVLRDNLFGLEIDARCTQIAAFNLALAAWKFGGYRKLPLLNLGCSGLGINARKEEWLKLANGEDRLRRGMEQLYDLFQQAPTLGSLIDPKHVGGDLLVAQFHELQPLLEKALLRENAKNDENLTEIGVTARDLAHAGEILTGDFTLVATNVPYVARGKQNEPLKDYCERFHREAKADLATCFVERCLAFCSRDSSVALVTPQNWLFLTSYKIHREQLLKSKSWLFLARLGFAAFQIMDWWAFSTCLIILGNIRPLPDSVLRGVDADAKKDIKEKSKLLIENKLKLVPQLTLLRNPDAVVSLDDIQTSSPLATFADSQQGLATADDSRFVRYFWEVEKPAAPRWIGYQGTPQEQMFSGKSRLIFWEDGNGALASSEQARIQGLSTWKSNAIAVKMMRDLRPGLFGYCAFDMNVSALVPKRNEFLLPIWCFVSSDEYHAAVRRINQKLNVTNATLAKVHFDLPRWQKVAEEKYPQGLPKPHSNDPTQWLFVGHPKCSENRLQIAVARMLGYRWPRQSGSSFSESSAIGPDALEQFADEDGVVCINPIKGEQSAAEGARGLLAAAFGDEWSSGKQNELLEEVGSGGKTLEDWLRNGFFEQHCQLFDQHPFIWHIWDGRRDGFSVLVNYHKLNRGNLEKLTYTFLGDWIARQKAAIGTGEEGSDARLEAALDLKSKLEKIIEGEAPHDIFVRWKPLEKQPIGWEPDLNDGVRLNIRPFVEAHVLRKDPKINWNKDRGKDVGSAAWYNKYDLRLVPAYKPGDRINDYHLTLDEKRKARGKN